MFFVFFFLMIRRPPRSTLFPYTRSSDLQVGGELLKHELFQEVDWLFLLIYLRGALGLLRGVKIRHIQKMEGKGTMEELCPMF